jgi:pimeloyl-ACP methyl ester carboxylesterase
MTPAEIRALSRLGGHAFGGLVSRIGQVHQAIGRRALTPIGPVGIPVRLVHDLVAQGTYRAIQSVAPTAAALAGEAAALIYADGQPAGREPRGNLALAALNAIAGDQPGLAPLAIPMAVRVGGSDVELASREIAAAFPRATTFLAVFVHGLAETEDSWRLRAGESQPYGSRLHAEFGYTPVYIRYNTGRHVSESGHDLADLLARLTAAWPTDIDEILLVGHSMGGLVIRSACHYGRQADDAWVDRVRHVFYLASPHLGAPLARVAGLAGWALAQAAETRPFATLVMGSSSVRDLRYGYVLDDDWSGCDQDCCVRDHRGDVPLLATANHYAISATVTADPGHPLGAVAGDLLVQPASAHGRRGARQHVPFRVESGQRFGGMHHFDLLNHPDVWAAMHGLLREQPSALSRRG